MLVGQTPSYGEGVTFAPLVELLSQAAESPSGDAGAVASALRELVAAQPDGHSVGDRLAQFLGVGDALGADTAWAVRRLLEVLASERPLVVMLDDLHWAEPPMLDLTDAVVERVHGPVLFLCLARPELLEQRPTWAAGKPRAFTTTLPPLSPEDSRRIGELLLGEDAPASVVDRVCETAEGNPLYLEQLTAMLADQGLLVDGRWLGAGDATVEIPASLQALLAARLDRLDRVPRLILERASIEGRRFRTGALRALASEVGPDELEAALASLDRSGLVQPEDEAGGRWRFAHALVVEAAYRGLSKGQRAQLHEQLADWLTVEDADRGRRQRVGRAAPGARAAPARGGRRCETSMLLLSRCARESCSPPPACGHSPPSTSSRRAIFSAVPQCSCRRRIRAASTCSPTWGWR